LTIAITANIKAAGELADELVEFLAGELKGGRAEAVAKVLVVTSSDKHRENVVKLRSVDAIDNASEWIVSVAMLSEGWDVKNVFQIYPHEKRAFNSKLLISQVLGRGLRRPEELTEQPLVYVFNHQRWGPEIEEFVAEVLDVETTIAQRPTDGRACLHVELHDLEFAAVPTGIEAKELEKPAEFGETIALRPQRARDEKTIFVSAVDSAKVDVLTTRVIDTLHPVAEVVADVRQRMLAHDKATGGTLAKTYPKKRVERMIVKSLKKLNLDGTEVSQENRQLILSAFGSLRQKTKRPGAALKREPIGLKTFNTSEMRAVTGRISALTSTLGLFYDTESRKLGMAEDEVALKKAREITVFNGMTRVSNSFLFKSPTNIVLTSHQPEYQFVERLMEQENAETLRSWIKAPDTGFYTIQFSFKKDDAAKRRLAEFNPDFFLWRQDEDEVIVVETKMASDTSSLNRGKLEAAKAHFEVVNALLEAEGEQRRYQFHMLAPDDFDQFFDALRAGDLGVYRSGLQAQLV
jgi:type III restriction enzyme